MALFLSAALLRPAAGGGRKGVNDWRKWAGESRLRLPALRGPGREMDKVGPGRGYFLGSQSIIWYIKRVIFLSKSHVRYVFTWNLIFKYW